MMRVGLYRPVHVKTLRSQKLRMLLTHRKLLQSKAIALDNDLRGTLRNFGLKAIGSFCSRRRLPSTTTCAVLCATSASRPSEAFAVEGDCPRQRPARYFAQLRPQGHRKLLQSKAIALDNDLRGTLRNFGLKAIGSFCSRRRLPSTTTCAVLCATS